MDEFIRSEQDLIIERCRVLKKIPKDIASNTPFRENLLAMFVCIFSRIPLFVCGKPGSSKSITIRILKNSFAKQQVLGREFSFLNGFPMVYIFEYQGSKQSNEDGIARIFRRAAAKTRTNQAGLMFFDEIGIAELSPNRPLKVLHEYLNKSAFNDQGYGGADTKDHGKFPSPEALRGMNQKELALRRKQYTPSFIGISNWDIDASKLNRNVYLARPGLSYEDLVDTSQQIIQYQIETGNRLTENKNAEIRKLAEQVSEAYRNFREEQRVRVRVG